MAGDSGDGIQLAGNQFSLTTALKGNDLSTFPDFPAEIRAPQGTVAGVSGFKINFGSTEIFTPGGQVDTLVVMNAAALKKFLPNLKPQGIIIANTSGFDRRNKELAHVDIKTDPLADAEAAGHKVIRIELNPLIKKAVEGMGLSTKDADRTKNMFMLGFVYWLYDRPLDTTQNFIIEKFSKIPNIAEANRKVLMAGYHYGETIEESAIRYQVDKAQQEPGIYRSIMGNEALAIGLIAASKKSACDLFYGSYPITPASDILHELAKHKNFGVVTFQAEDEIAAITASIGASYGGKLAVTGTSGPGMALKTEALGLAVMLEQPLVIVNVQRGGPSTGLPTKTEQADLLQALYGRNGEAPIPVLAAATPSDCFYMAFEACRIALTHATPVILLSDGFIANGAEPWKYPQSSDLAEINPPFVAEGTELFQPYQRDENLIRPWAVPGQAGLEHRIGGIEKENITGNISYEGENHQRMVQIRSQKIALIAQDIPEAQLSEGDQEGDLLLLGWGSTYGAIKVAARNLIAQGHKVGHLHLQYLNPLQSNLADIINKYKACLIPELNAGQLATYLKSELEIKPHTLHKIKGVPFMSSEIEAKALEILSERIA